MSNNIGAGVRAKQIAKWKDGVAKNVDLLVAFPSEPIDDDVLAEFRGVVAERIKGLADYLTTGQWGLFDGQPLMPPPSKEEREAQAEENAARAEAERNAQAVEAVAEAVSTSPLALPESKCVHWDETKDGCDHPEFEIDGCENCDGYRRECAKFSLEKIDENAARTDCQWCNEKTHKCECPKFADEADDVCYGAKDCEGFKPKKSAKKSGKANKKGGKK